MDHVRWLKDVSIADVPQVGGKNASLGEMIRGLSGQCIRVPGGFATTASAYRAFLANNDLAPFIAEALGRYRAGATSLREAGKSVRERILAATLSADMEAALRDHYRTLSREAGKEDIAVAVRSSATAEDLPGASFAGQQETFLNVRGEEALIDACRRCYASLFTDRAITYREIKGFDPLDIALSVGVQPMVRTDLGASGVMFTIDPETGFPGVVVISAAWGLGETVVQGAVDPDSYMLFKAFFDRPGIVPLLERTRGAKAIKMVYGDTQAERTRTVETSAAEREAFVLGDDDILTLARWGAAIERHYGRAMDIEWGKDGETGELFILQARPETVHGAASVSCFEVYTLKEKGKLIATGAAVGSGMAAGEACLLNGIEEAGRFRDGQILVAIATNPDWVPLMKRAAGIVTDHGGPTSHAAIVSRELGLPAVVGTGDATAHVRDGQPITINCAQGEEGLVYDGRLAFDRQVIETAQLPDPGVDIMVNMANPSAAFRWWRLPAKGVGLARMEFIIGGLIKLHPMAAAHPERLSPDDAVATRALSQNYESPADYFVQTLAEGIAKLAAPFHPYPAIVRLSDFKSNEYASLIGGKTFEPGEANPMLGFRGASRYYDPRYKDGFVLECRAMKAAREELGFSNILVMIPFCRTVGEADKVLAVMAENGLRRGKDGLQVYMMCEIPSNVVMAREFARRFDGFSIGSNDLAQLVLGVDRDSAELAKAFDERDEAVKRMIAEAIAGAHQERIKIGICGQGPSNHPDFARFLIEQGIDSLSLNPDSFVKTVEALARMREEARPFPGEGRGPASEIIAAGLRPSPEHALSSNL
ncbi:phosphoenolpyruvate synthase [Allosphingosinicella flava]|uniref:Phosphoenolpyruvate synthase n=1 Tax=Allosphingosinicella flava TaxID=2771430 RepID=A0A7T2GJE7_9SPHN|nr:phosphoenolpyruvate synthase [Sphingosinicella flava]QPQ54960.1 phosphoenolpyruvate synthase [Sphingosinicella flava]